MPPKEDTGDWTILPIPEESRVRSIQFIRNILKNKINRY